MQIQAGASGLTVAKLGEAEVYGAAGFEDVFIANEIVGALKVARLLELSRRCRVTAAVDSLEGAAPISRAAELAGMRIPVRMEIDTGLGRAGVRTVEDAVELGKRLRELPAMEMAGIFTHEGHGYKVSDTERPALCAKAAQRMRDVKDALEMEGIAAGDVSVGSTPGLAAMAAEDGVTELRPGVYVFGDVMQTRMGFGSDDLALTVLATVVSRPDAGTAIVDSGTKSLAGDRGTEGPIHGLVPGHEDAVFDWASEEHGHINLLRSSWRPVIGEKVRIVPYHACAATNMHDELYAVRGEQVEAIWKVAARGKIR
jgi:D-serine deaminase-like pyridoxal phosphate-dependent protein